LGRKLPYDALKDFTPVSEVVSQPLLIVVFKDGARPDDQPQFGLARRLPVRPHVEAQTVGKRANKDLWIDRHLVSEGMGSDRRGRGLAPGCRRLRRPDGRDSGEQEGQYAAPSVPEADRVHISSYRTEGPAERAREKRGERAFPEPSQSIEGLK
jgi:hypothetical protein